MYICVSTYVYICLYMYICVYFTCVCTYVCMGTYVNVCVPVYVVCKCICIYVFRGQRSMSSFLFSHISTLLSGFLTEPRVQQLAILPGLQTPEILLSLGPQHWDYTHVIMPIFLHGCWVSKLKYSCLRCMQFTV